MFSISDLPLINASLNAVSTVFISLGWFLIRRNIWQRHVPCMIAAIISSTLFLVGYIVYHVHVGRKIFRLHRLDGHRFIFRFWLRMFCSLSSRCRW